ncbi:MAG: PIN domain-containing protein, partial [Archaeoglobaceae archaeon]|nr:PIN domain-containing protein [Archaeoglobaceae archaeon]
MNDVIVSEVFYGYMRAVANLKPFELREKVKEMNFNFDVVKELLEMFFVLPINFGTNIIEIIERYKLLPNDALIAATCKHYGIRRIAT